MMAGLFRLIKIIRLIEFIRFIKVISLIAVDANQLVRWQVGGCDRLHLATFQANSLNVVSVPGLTNPNIVAARYERIVTIKYYMP